MNKQIRDRIEKFKKYREKHGYQQSKGVKYLLRSPWRLFIALALYGDEVYLKRNELDVCLRGWGADDSAIKAAGQVLHQMKLAGYTDNNSSEPDVGTRNCVHWLSDDGRSAAGELIGLLFIALGGAK